jgi:hypothetical protein
MQGRSWRPLLEGRPVAWRKAWFYEYFRENNYAVPTVLAVRTEASKPASDTGCVRTRSAS